MINVRSLLTPKVKDLIKNFWLYRLYCRLGSFKKNIRFSVEITTKCNARCDMCTREELVSKKELDVGDMNPVVFAKIVEEMKLFAKSGYSVVFAPMGLGEPLMSKDLIKILKLVKREVPGVKIILVTNGVLLSPEISANLVAIGVDEISVSLNTRNSRDYRKHVGGENYDLVVKNIVDLIKIRDKSRKKTTKIFVQYLDYDGESGDKFVGDMDRWYKLMSEGDKCYVHPVVNQAGLKSKKSTLGKTESFPCNSPVERVVVKINGDMYPCDPCLYGGKKRTEELFLGNVLEKSFFDIFRDKGSKIWQIREMMKKGDYKKLPSCKVCDTYKLGINTSFKVGGRWW